MMWATGSPPTTNPYSESTSLSYDAANRLTTQTNANSSVSTFSYDSANRTTDVWHKDSSANVLAHYSYTYDYASNVITRTDTNGDVTTFGYDNADQLTGESRSNGNGLGYTLAFTYDHNHNRHTRVLNSVTDTYSYDAHDKLTGITGGTNKTYGYDSNGNCTSVTVGSSVTTLTYDVENRVTAITYPSSATNSFAYNGEDLRTQKVDSSGTKNYVCDGDSPASPVLKDGAAVYTLGLSERRGTTSKFLHADALGSTRGITDSTQTVTDSMLYDAFGNTLSRTGTTPTPFGFVGASQYQSDINSGLQLLGHRYYDPSIGRFLSSDPAQAGTNWYAYCDNCPLSGTDATGLDKIDDKRNKIDDGIKKKYGDLPTGRTYTTEKEAIQAGSDYTGTLTQGTGVEWGVVVTHYKTAGGVDKYQLVHLTRGTQDHTEITIPPDAIDIIHAHPKRGPARGEEFSRGDQHSSDVSGIPIIVGTPKGRIRQLMPRPGNRDEGELGTDEGGHAPNKPYDPREWGNWNKL